MKDVTSVDVAGKRVFIRVDYNVPYNYNSENNNCTITDDRRIVASLPTLQWLQRHRAKLIILTHIGRPDGKFSQELSIAFDAVTLRLQELLGTVVTRVTQASLDGVDTIIDSMKPSEVILLPNLRFDKGEETNDSKLAAKYAKLAEIYINDAFSVSHRAHMSVEAITKLMPSYAGLLFKQEFEQLRQIKDKAKQPFWLILGGSKPADKIPVIEHLLPQLSGVAVGGMVANAFLAANKQSIGASPVDEVSRKSAAKILQQCQQADIQLLLPSDVVVERSSGQAEHCLISKLPDDAVIKDLGHHSVEAICQHVDKAATIFWNGTLGVFEQEQFSEGTTTLAKCLAEKPNVVIIAGGDTLAAVDKDKLTKSFAHLSLGGGASLEFLAGKTLPGVAALEANN